MTFFVPLVVLPVAQCYIDMFPVYYPLAQILPQCTLPLVRFCSYEHQLVVTGYNNGIEVKVLVYHACELKKNKL